MDKYSILFLVGLMNLQVCAQELVDVYSHHEANVFHPESTFYESFVLTCASTDQEKTSLCKKIVRANCLVSGYNISMGAYLLAAPEYVSKWNKKEKFKIESIVSQYKKSFSEPPVIDNDLWIVNYIGHPYQGSFYYNSIRAQEATFWQSSFFCIGQSLLWEFVWEGGMEQPSIQDLISTPIAGIIVGELTHEATIKMGRNGFKWYEIALVCLFNPAYAINNGFRRNQKIKSFH